MAKKDDKKNAPANTDATANGEATATPEKKPRKKSGTSIVVQARDIFKEMVTALQDAGERVAETSLFSAELLDKAYAVYAKLGTQGTRGLKPAERLAEIQGQIDAIYVLGQSDISVLTTRQPELQTLFVKKQNLENRVKTMENKAKEEANETTDSAASAGGSQ